MSFGSDASPLNASLCSLFVLSSARTRFHQLFRPTLSYPNFAESILRPLTGPQSRGLVVVDLVLGVLPREEGEAPADRRKDEHLDGHAGLALGAAGDAAGC